MRFEGRDRRKELILIKLTFWSAYLCLFSYECKKHSSLKYYFKLLELYVYRLFLWDGETSHTSY